MAANNVFKFHTMKMPFGEANQSLFDLQFVQTGNYSNTRSMPILQHFYFDSRFSLAIGFGMSG